MQHRAKDKNHEHGHSLELCDANSETRDAQIQETSDDDALLRRRRSDSRTSDSAHA